MRLYLIRHGETDWNKKKLLQGKQDIPLNENGRNVARMTAAGLKDVAFDEVWSSPLKRAYETGSIVTGGRCPVYTDKRLEEIGFGIAERCCYDKDGYNIPDPDFMYFFSDPSQYRAPQGGESLENLINRTSDFLQELIQKPENQEKIILIATHGAALQSILSGIRKKELSQFWKDGVHKNCAVTILDVKEGKITFVQENRIYYDETPGANCK